MQKVYHPLSCVSTALPIWLYCCAVSMRASSSNLPKSHEVLSISESEGELSSPVAPCAAKRRTGTEFICLCAAGNLAERLCKLHQLEAPFLHLTAPPRMEAEEGAKGGQGGEMLPLVYSPALLCQVRCCVEV